MTFKTVKNRIELYNSGVEACDIHIVNSRYIMYLVRSCCMIPSQRQFEPLFIEFSSLMSTIRLFAIIIPNSDVYTHLFSDCSRSLSVCCSRELKCVA